MKKKGEKIFRLGTTITDSEIIICTITAARCRVRLNNYVMTVWVR